MDFDFNLDKIKKVYFIGIKGAGMVALAEFFFRLGKVVIGSDVKEKFFSDEILTNLKIPYFEGFSAENLHGEEKDLDLIVYSTAYNENNNPEVKYFKEKNLPALSYPEFLGRLSQIKKTIAVCGTHGKTTTSAMIAFALKELGQNPSAIIGSKIRQLGSSCLAGNSEYLVIEADEYQNKLALYQPFGVVLTNLDFDHPDFFADFQAYKKVFQDFVSKIPPNGFLVTCLENPAALEVANFAGSQKLYFYGKISKEEKIKLIEKFQALNKEIQFVYLSEEKIQLQLAGYHNRLNAMASVAVCAGALDLPQEKMILALQKFQGTTRRFETLGERNGALIIDDYAHHPKEIAATLSGAREKYPNKNIICIFHPHTFTRTKALLDEFSQSFTNADEVIVLDIYGSAREKQGGVHSKDLVEKIRNNFQGQSKYIATMNEVFEDLKDRIGKNDLVITMGAGNVCDLGKKLANSILK